MKKLSIIVPCYNVARYLPRCLNSLLAQTLDGIEIICINDGSPDDCLMILRDYEQKHPDVIRVIDKKNGGVWAARRDGIAAASGEYIGFIDPDDHVRNDFADKLFRAAKSCDADIACCGFDRIDDNTGHIYSREMTRFKYASFDIQTDPGLMPEVNAAIWNKIFRAPLLKNMRDIESVPGALDDVVFAHLIYINSRRITFVAESLVYYTVRSGSVISSLNAAHVAGIYKAFNQLRNAYVQDAPKLLPYLDAAAFLHLGISMLHRLSFEKGVDLAKAIRDNRAYLDKRFPLWRNNPYMRLSYVLSHRMVNLKLMIVKTLYGLHLFRAFLFVYGSMIKYLGIDIKW